MKQMKLLGLVAVALTAGMAFAAASASSTVLYKEATPLGKGLSISWSLAGTTILTTTSGTVLEECTGGGMTGVTSTAGGEKESVKGVFEKTGVTWSGCTKTTDTLEGGTFEIRWITGTKNGTVIGSGLKVTIAMAAELGSTCSYTLGTGKDLGELVGVISGDANLGINAVINGAEGNNFLCPSDTKWVASYVVTSPTPLHVTQK